ncbi:hypothetical protein RND81_03G034000 [Saponaria officinalis]|uniref:Uncharacterized protein n=1 Tax=Saponaria officinalis TaxID=3572 RepID=A0AAW1M531_SAPOF
MSIALETGHHTPIQLIAAEPSCHPARYRRLRITATHTRNKYNTTKYHFERWVVVNFSTCCDVRNDVRDLNKWAGMKGIVSDIFYWIMTVVNAHFSKYVF